VPAITNPESGGASPDRELSNLRRPDISIAWGSEHSALRGRRAFVSYGGVAAVEAIEAGRKPARRLRGRHQDRAMRPVRVLQPSKTLFETTVAHEPRLMFVLALMGVTCAHQQEAPRGPVVKTGAGRGTPGVAGDVKKRIATSETGWWWHSRPSNTSIR